MKKRFLLGFIGILTISALLFSGCSNSQKTAQQTTNTLTADTNSYNKKDAKSITDSDLINSANEDSPTKLTPVDTQSEQLSSDEIDSLLDDNTNLNNN